MPPQPLGLQSQASLWELKAGQVPRLTLAPVWLVDGAPSLGLAPSIPRGDPQACTWASLVSLPPGKSGEAPRCPTRPPRCRSGPAGGEELQALVPPKKRNAV